MEELNSVEESYCKIIGSILKKERKSRSLDISELVKRLNEKEGFQVTNEQIEKYESGCGLIDSINLKGICKVLEIDHQELLDIVS